MKLDAKFRMLLGFAMLTFIFSCDDEITTSSTDDDPCELSTSYVQNSCDSYTFTSSSDDDTFWSINGDYVATGSNFDFIATSAGTYTICGGIETPDCPMGASDCTTITIGTDCLDEEEEEVECEINISNVSNSCSSFTFSSDQGVNTFWSVNGEYDASGINFDFDATYAGTYTICGGIETGDCPMGASDCTTITIGTDCLDEEVIEGCEINISSVSNSCASYTFSSNQGDETFWSVNDDYIATGSNFDFTANAAGTYTICGGFETPECPMGGQECETITVGQDCF